jgi:predicted Zn-dependent protease
LASWQWEEYGQTAEAIKLIERALRLDPERAWIRMQLSFMYLDVGDVGAAENVISGHAGMAPSGLIAPALRRGDWRKAGQLAYARPEGQLHDDSEMLAVWAIRDYALKSGELDRAIKYLDQVYDLHPNQPVVAGENGFVFASLALLLRKKGDQVAAQKLVNGMTQACRASGRPVMCATAHALAGEREAALESLHKTVTVEGHISFWWYTIDRAPQWDAMRSDPAFQTIAEGLRNDAAQQRALLEQMRSKGDVPTRSSAILTAVPSP